MSAMLESASPHALVVEDREVWLVREKAQIMRRQMRTGGISAMVAAAAITAVLYRTGGPIVLAWTVCMVLGYGIREWWLVRADKAGSAPELIVSFSAISSVLLGLLNTLPAPLFFPMLEPNTRGVFTGVFVGWIAVGALIMGVHPPSYRVYVIGSFTNLALGWWLSAPGLEAISLTIIIIVAALILMRFSQRLAELFTEVVNIRHEKARLVAQLEKALADTEAAQRTKLRFIAAASHDLLQPVHALLLLTGLLDPSKPERQADVGRRIRLTAESIESMFRGILEIARMDAGTLHAQRRIVPLAPLGQAVQAAYESRCTDRGLELLVDCPPSVAVWGDPALLDRVVRNLVDNAVKFTVKGEVRLNCEAGSEQVSITVSDTGVGISAEDMPQICDPFFRGRGAREVETEGLGLGLAITSHMVHLMGGILRINSTPGSGTTVMLTMPRAQMATSQTPLPARSNRALRYRRIVLLEDDRLAREATLLWLIEHGAQVISASGIERVLADCDARGWTPEFILADFRLGAEFDGLECISRLRKRYGWCPAALITGENIESHSVPDDVLLLRKPLKPEQLETLLAQS